MCIYYMLINLDGKRQVKVACFLKVQQAELKRPETRYTGNTTSQLRVLSKEKSLRKKCLAQKKDLGSFLSTFKKIA